MIDKASPSIEVELTSTDLLMFVAQADMHLKFHVLYYIVYMYF